MIVLTLEESVEQAISGIPESVEFSASKPATIYYTLDGTAPSSESLMATGKVYLPTSGATVSLKAVAISASDSSSVLEVEYKTDSTDLSSVRYSEGEGIIVMSHSDEYIDSLSVTADGDPAQTVSVSMSELEIKASTTNSIGETVAGGKTTVDFINFSKTTNLSDEFGQSSPNDNSEFDPSARFIVIDGSTPEAFENQVVKIVNRPYNTFDPSSNFYKERLGVKEPIITGNFVKSFYNPDTGIYISYYWENLESRWIKSVQRIEKNSLNISWKSDHPLVFRWVQDRALTTLS